MRTEDEIFVLRFEEATKRKLFTPTSVPSAIWRRRAHIRV
jgi:hypothetical protein